MNTTVCKKHEILRVRRTNGKTVCRLCDNDYQKAHYRSNPQKMRARKRTWMAKQRSTPEGKARQNAIQRKCWANGGSERNRAYIKKFMDEHFFAWRVRLFNSHFSTQYIAKDFASMWKNQRGLCALSGVKLTKRTAEIDHRIPIAKNGSHELSNLRWVLREVNWAKRDLLDDEFLVLCSNVARWIGRRILACHERTGS